MVQLTTQRDLRPAQSLSFCFVCGQPIAGNNHPDHVPPKAVFHAADRNFPLKVACHERCNTSHNNLDTQIGQLVGLLHGTIAAERDRIIRGREVTFGSDRRVTGGIEGLRLGDQVWRWVRGFHAALYGEHLPEWTPNDIRLPVPVVEFGTGEPVIRNTSAIHASFVAQLKRNRAAGQIDSIRTNAGKLRYDCFWGPIPEFGIACVFGLDLYSWHRLNDPSYAEHFPPRGCVGAYLGAAIPPGAAIAVESVGPFPNEHPLNPFDD